MKVISGTLKGRVIEGFDIKGTRPTMDRIKESLFAMIQDKIDQSVCLDLFAGSGNLGIEAISNGAASCVFVDHNPKAIEVIKKNAARFHITKQVAIYQMDYQKALSFFKEKKQSFDLLFLDPPYEMNCAKTIMDILCKTNLVKEEGLVIWEVEHEEWLEDYPYFTLYKKRQYKDKWIYIYQKTCKIDLK